MLFNAGMDAKRKLSEKQIADAQRLKSLWEREFKGKISQEEVAYRCGWKTQGAFNQYLHGKIPIGLNALLKISRALGVDPGDISPHLAAKLSKHGIAGFDHSAAPKSPGSSNDELEFFGHMDAWDSSTPLDEDEVELPLFREVELAAGGGATQVIENHGAKLRFAKSTLRRAGVPAESAACAFVRGNSMEPVMPDGTCVGVNTADKAIKDGEIYAIDHGGMLRVKYLHRRPGGGIKIVSQNASEHPVEEVTAEDMAANVRVIGRVFWWSVLR